MDTNQFTQQLVEFAGVEQQLKTNSDLDQLVTLNQSSQAIAALSFVGATVTASGKTSQLQNGSAIWNITSPQPATASISILDQNGNTVATAQQALTAGTQPFSWNGTTSTGTVAPNGFYQIQITAQNSSGQNVTVSTQFTGTVTAVDLTGSQPMLVLGSGEIPISQVISIQNTGSGLGSSILSPASTLGSSVSSALSPVSQLGSQISSALTPSS
jgi:flagellar basal-body rod modification protein FlgD